MKRISTLKSLSAWVSLAALATFVAVDSTGVASVGFSTNLSSDYFIITTTGAGLAADGATSVGGADDNLTSSNVSNFEIGANKAPVPSTDDFLAGGGSSGGPTLRGAVPDLPSGTVPVEQGIGGHANVAITNPADEFAFQNVGVYADPNIGIQVASNSQSSNKSSNSFFNDPNQFPNTFDPNTQTGNDVNPNQAVQSTRIDADGNPGNAGVTFGFDHSSLLDELLSARNAINTLAATGTINLSGGNAGQFDTATTLGGPASIASTPTQPGAFNPSSDSRDFTITLGEGLNVIDFITDGNDISLSNSNLVIDGPEGSTAVFRTTGDNFLVSNSNILLGDGGIGLNNVLFVTDEDTNDTVFGFNNTIINGAAFWSLGNGGGEINVQNGQGSTQFIADTVLLSDVRFTKWAYNPETPPPPPPSTNGDPVPEPVSLAVWSLIGCVALSRCRPESAA